MGMCSTAPVEVWRSHRVTPTAGVGMMTPDISPPAVQPRMLIKIVPDLLNHRVNKKWVLLGLSVSESLPDLCSRLPLEERNLGEQLLPSFPAGFSLASKKSTLFSAARP